MKFLEWWTLNRQNIINTLDNFFVKLLGGKLRTIILFLINIVDAYLTMQEKADTVTEDATATVMSTKLMGATLLEEPEKVASIKLADFVIDKIKK